MDGKRYDYTNYYTHTTHECTHECANMQTPHEGMHECAPPLSTEVERSLGPKQIIKDPPLAHVASSHLPEYSHRYLTNPCVPREGGGKRGVGGG